MSAHYVEMFIVLLLPLLLVTATSVPIEVEFPSIEMETSANYDGMNEITRITIQMNEKRRNLVLALGEANAIRQEIAMLENSLMVQSQGHREIGKVDVITQGVFEQFQSRLTPTSEPKLLLPTAAEAQLHAATIHGQEQTLNELGDTAAGLGSDVVISVFALLIFAGLASLLCVARYGDSAVLRRFSASEVQEFTGHAWARIGNACATHGQPSRFEDNYESTANANTLGVSNVGDSATERLNALTRRLCDPKIPSDSTEATV